MKVRFSTREEFVRELRKDSSIVERGIVRVTFRYHDTKIGVKRVELVATARVRDVVVVLKRFLGEVGWSDEIDAKTNERADHERAELLAELEPLFQIRSGVYEP